MYSFTVVALPGARRKQRTFFFTRVELSQLLSVYSSLWLPANGAMIDQ